MEVIFVTIQDRTLMNRGFLLGPYCPIYGLCAILMTFMFHIFQDQPIVLFCVAAFFCTFIEYLTGYILEKIFHARWWDYSKNMFNLHGRVCLLNTCLFGILGVVLVRYINPVFVELLSTIPIPFFFIFGSFFLLIFISDIILTAYALLNIKNSSYEQRDNTIEMSIKVRSRINDRNIPIPNFKKYVFVVNNWINRIKR